MRARVRRALCRAGPSLWRRAAETRPEVHALCAGQHRVENQHREEVRLGGRRRVKHRLHISRRPFPLDDDAPLPKLGRLVGPDPIRLRPVRNRGKMTLGAAHHIVGVHVTDDDQRGIVRDVEPAVVAVQIVARHRSEDPRAIRSSDAGMDARGTLWR